MACVTVTSLVRTLELEFLSYQPRPVVVKNGLISGNKELIESLHDKLQSLMEQFDEYRMDGVEALKLLESKLRDVASRVEDEIEFQVADLHVEKTSWHRLKFCQIFQREVEKPDPCLKLRHTLQQAMRDIDHIEDELVKVQNTIHQQGRNMELDVLPKSDEVIMMGDPSQHASHSQDIMVGKHDELETIMELLVHRASHQQKVVSIKGMGGIGKTTLAKRLYEDSSIVSHFDKLAWVVASQHHDKRKMLVDLLKSMGSNVESGSDADLALRLRQGLLGERYLVVIDDIWSTEAWDDVKLCFPDNGNGSRVLLTTRHEEVANYTHSDNEFSHQMHFLAQTESWDLFCGKVLLKGVEFETIVRPIVEKCNGLPLAIVVAAGMFSKLNTLEEWKHVAKAVNSSRTTTIAESCSRILSFSYNHLHHSLKACFLYLGVFPEDEVVNASDLARLWAAEGFVKATENESFEAVGQKYVQELSDRNLILVSEQSSNGRDIKAFRIHDVLHAFCVREAQNENLLKVVGENGLNFYQKDFRWLSIQSSGFDARTLPSSSKNCRSIFYFLEVEAAVGNLNLQKFNLLTVLYFPNVWIYWDFVGAFKFNKVLPPVHLRYMSNPYEKFSLDQFNLCNNLQTLCGVSHNISHCLDYPHLCYCNSSLEYLVYPPKFVHQNMQSILRIRDSSCTKELFTKIPYLKKLDILIGDGSTVIDCIHSIGNLAYLQQLEILKIDGRDFTEFVEYPICSQIALLKNLKTLKFLRMNFRLEEINVLSILPRLEVLKLDRVGYRHDKKWTLREEDQFCQLVYLELDYLRLEQWEVNADNFPKLERLQISGCCSLEEIPSSFEEISTLKSIKLWGCYPSLVTSAKQIQEMQHEEGNYDMVVIEECTEQPEDTDPVEMGKVEAFCDKCLEGCVEAYVFPLLKLWLRCRYNCM